MRRLVAREVPSGPSPQTNLLRNHLVLVREQIASTRKVLNDTTPCCAECGRGGPLPHHRAQLLKSLDTLLDRERELLGIPLLGQQKPVSNGKRSTTQDYGPLPEPATSTALPPASTPALPAPLTPGDPPTTPSLPPPAGPVTT